MPRKKKKKNMYWGEKQEKAIKDYIETESIQNRHKLYVEIIQPAFKKLIENIFYTYNFNKILNNLNNVEHEAISHLYEKINRFKPDKGRAFSFFGTVIKNWFIQECNKEKKKITIDDEEQSNHINSLSLEQFDETEKNESDQELISMMISEIEYVIKHRDKSINKDDIAVAEIIQKLLKDYTLLDIYSRKQVYVYLKEGTGLPTRKITKSLKKIREMYSKTKGRHNE